MAVYDMFKSLLSPDRPACWASRCCLFRAHFTAVGETQRNGSYLTAPPAMRDHTKGLLIGVSAVLSGSVCCVPVRMLGHSNVSPTPAVHPSHDAEPAAKPAAHPHRWAAATPPHHPDRLPADGDGSLGAAGVHTVAAALGADVPLPHLPRALPVGAARRAQGGVARADRHDRLRLPRDAGHGHHRGLPADEGLQRRLHHQRPSKPHPCVALTGRRPHAVRRRRRRRSSAC